MTDESVGIDLLRVEIVVQRVPRIAVDDVRHALEQQGDRLERAGPCGGEGNLAARNQLAGHRIDLCRTRLLVQNPEVAIGVERQARSEEHTSELQSLMRISYAVFCLKKKTNKYQKTNTV